jgi:hypothetical protein
VISAGEVADDEELLEYAAVFTKYREVGEGSILSSPIPIAFGFETGCGFSETDEEIPG